jgi:hypothetical protein
MTQEELDKIFEEEMKPIYARKERLSTKLNAMTLEECIAYWDVEGENLFVKRILKNTPSGLTINSPNNSLKPLVLFVSSVRFVVSLTMGK